MAGNRSEYFERVGGRVNLQLMGEKLVVIAGVGSVGSVIARELAGYGVGRFVLADGDRLDD